MIGETIAHYRVIEKLGSGGMGEVFLAEDTRLNRQVALKFMPEMLAAVPEARQRFLREAQAAAALNHPNIVTIYEVAEHAHRPYMAMEFIEGATLKEYCAGHARSIDELLAVAGRIGAGLQRAHAAGITHRDLKPGNILVDTDGNTKIVDFGLAQVKGAAKLTQTGSTMGTASYMSPEQAQGREVDHRSDLFSLGAVMFEMFAGRPPFSGEHDAAIVYAIVHEEPEPLARYKSDVPDELQRIVSKCLAKSPDQRYQSAGDLLADLHRLRHGGSSSFSISKPPSSRRKMVAVLPFENLGPAEDEYFADGITEEIISRLATVSELGVISRTSTIQYKGTKKTIRDIGRELGTDYVLEGTVRWGRSKDGPSRVRITPQLIQVADDTHLWSERYDKVIDDIFDVQSDIAEQVFKQLNVTLLDEQKAGIEAKPTENMDAYSAYLLGRDYAGRSYSIDDYTLAITMFEKAVELDPGFALAWAALADVHSNMYHHGYDRSASRIKKTEEAVKSATALDADAPDVRVALGLYHYRCHREWDKALAEFEKAAEIRKTSSEIMLMIGATHRRKGNALRGYEYIKRAAELNPHHALTLMEVAGSLTILRRFDDSIKIYERVRAMQPDLNVAYELSHWTYVHGPGDLKAAEEMLKAAPKADDPRSAHLWCLHYLLARNAPMVLKYYEKIPTDMCEDQPWSHAKPIFAAYAYRLQGDESRARDHFIAALAIAQRHVEARPKDHRLHAALAMASAGAGLRDQALASINRAIDMFNPSIDAMTGYHTLYQGAQVAGLLGDAELALSRLEPIVNNPVWISRKIVRFDPAFDLIREDAAFSEFATLPDVVF